MEISREEIKKILKFYGDNYILAGCLDIDDTKKYIGSKNNRFCRFCNKNNKETSFKNIAHALPEFIGNKNIISYQECDICNEFFAKHLENDLAAYSKLIRSVGQVSGKKGVPSVKNKNEVMRKIGNKFEIRSLLDSDFIDLNKDTKELTINEQSDPFIERAAFKCLIKMGLSLLPEDELINFRAALKWIKCEDHNKSLIGDKQYQVWRTFTKGIYPYEGTHNVLLKRKNDTKVPYMIYLVAFGNSSFQVIIPSPEKDEVLTQCNYMSFLTPYMLYKQEDMQLFSEQWSNSLKKSMPRSVTLKFETVTEEHIE